MILRNPRSWTRVLEKQGHFSRTRNSSSEFLSSGDFQIPRTQNSCRKERSTVQCLFFCIPVLAKNGQICIFQRIFSYTIKLVETSSGFQTNPNILRKKQHNSHFVRALLQLQFVVKNDNFSFSTRGNRNISNYEYARNFWNQQSYLKKCAESE